MSRIRKTAIMVVACFGLAFAGVASAYAIPGQHPQVRKVCRVLDPEAKHAKRANHDGRAGAPSVRRQRHEGVMGEVADHYCVPGGGKHRNRVNPSARPAAR
ncbi:hypothetical protein [Embleya scabrispora]|uniref:hypothetical protein n=1 Tax=Embleya scabrispora TaxID=159449 RepID=UPI00131A1BE0|nr:hypothetical protein [Embleya scabrispora]MYS84194.1 hypothetical protein [Streptomyces sp. SID5474]